MHSSGSSEKNFLDKILEGLVGSSIIIMTIVIFFQIIARYVLNASLAWSEELARSMQIWLVFMGAALAVKRKSYIGMTDLLDRFPPAMFKFFQLFGDLVVLGFSLFFTYQGFVIYERISYQTLPILGFKMAYLYLAMPVCGILSAVYVVLRVVKRYTDKNATGVQEKG